jgi:hypothetical protein
MLRPAHRSGWVHRHHLAGDKPVEQQTHRSELLLHVGRQMGQLASPRWSGGSIPCLLNILRMITSVAGRKASIAEQILPSHPRLEQDVAPKRSSRRGRGEIFSFGLAHAGFYPRRNPPEQGFHTVCLFLASGNCVLTAALARASAQTEDTRPMPRWHRDSIFGPGPRRPLDRNTRARFRFLCRAHRGVNRLTANDVAVGEVLVSALGDDGRLDLAHATIAARALCHPATVRRALGRLRGLGLVSWVRRLVRGSGTGWRCEQSSNAYMLATPACDAHAARPVQRFQTKEKQEARDELRRAAAAAPDLLLRRRRAMAAVFGG